MPNPTPAPPLLGARRRAGVPAASMRAWAWLMAAALSVIGCAQTAPVQPTSSAAATGTAGSQGKSVATNFPDLPMPQGAKINVDKTLVVGTKTWFGQLTLDTSQSADTMFEFYSRELANYGWRRIAAVRAPTSILTYDRDNRVLAIAIQPSRVYGSEVTVTVSPREEAIPEGPAGGPAVGPAIGPTGGPIMPPPVRQVR